MGIYGDRMGVGQTCSLCDKEAILELTGLEGEFYLCEDHVGQISVWSEDENAFRYYDLSNLLRASEGEHLYWPNFPNDVRHLCKYKAAVVEGYEYCPSCGAGRKAKKKVIPIVLGPVPPHPLESYQCRVQPVGVC